MQESYELLITIVDAVENATKGDTETILTILGIISDSQDTHGDHSSDRDIDNMNQTQQACNLAVLVATLYICTGTAQDDFGGGDDAGADMDLESMTGGDGGGQDSKNAANNKKFGEKSFSEESILALQQLGVIIGKSAKLFIFNLLFLEEMYL